MCGMGWTETRLDYDDNPEGDPKVNRTDPLEMCWDRNTKKRDLIDGRRKSDATSRLKRRRALWDARRTFLSLGPGNDKRDAPFE